MAKGHLPSWGRLAPSSTEQASAIVTALRAGHLSRIKEVRIYHCNVDVRHAEYLAEALATHEGKLDQLELLRLERSDRTTRYAIHKLLTSPMCSDLRELRATPFVSEYLISSGGKGRPSLRTLWFWCISADEVTCFADALLLGGGGGSAPNLEEVHFEYLGNDAIKQLGSQLFARDALASIITLEFSGIDFEDGSMAALDGWI